MVIQHGAGLGGTRKQLIIQIFLLIAVFFAFSVLKDISAAKASLFGGLIALFNTLLLSWHIRRAERIAGDSAEKSLRMVYLCAAERFALTIGLFLLGLLALKLEPLPLIAGFIIVQAAVFISGLFIKGSD